MTTDSPTTDSPTTDSPTPETTESPTTTGDEPGLETSAGAPSVTSVSANETVVSEGQPFEIIAHVENPTESQASLPVELSLFDEVVESRTVSLSANDDRTVRFVHRIEAPGEYTATVNGESVEIVVDGDGASDSALTVEAPWEEPLQDPSSLSGTLVMGVLLPLVLLLAVGLRIVG